MRKFGLLLIAGVLVAFVWEVARSQSPPFAPRLGPSESHGKLQDPEGTPVDPKTVASTDAEKGKADNDSDRRPILTGRSSPENPATDDAKLQLAVLKGRLPGVLDAWQKEHCSYRVEFYKPKVRLVRRISPAEAKITFVWERANKGVRESQFDIIVSFNLRYCDGAWTTTTWDDSSGPVTKEDRFLILAIDEAGGK